MFGNEKGAVEAAKELGLHHEPHVERNEFGTKRLDYMFCGAQAIARHDLLWYINCDILLMEDFCDAIKRVREKHRHFLMVGRRWDIEVPASFSPEDKDCERHLRLRVLQNGRPRGSEWIDYFVFSRGLYREDMPPFVVGRVFWDNWLVWKALASHFSIVDASNAVLAAHQNHDYGYHPLGRQGVFCGAESERNYELAGGWRHLRTLEDATEVLRRGGLGPSRVRCWASAKRYARQAWGSSSRRNPTRLVLFLGVDAAVAA